MRDLVSNIGLVSLIAPAALSADSTPVAVDLATFDSAAVAIHIGVGGITFTGTNKIEFVMTHSDDDATYDPVTDADMQGVTGITSGIVKSLKAAHAAADVTKLGYIGNRRYLKLLADFGGTHASPTPLAATVILGNARNQPVPA